jgi:hypothetical protein
LIKKDNKKRRLSAAALIINVCFLTTCVARTPDVPQPTAPALDIAVTVENTAVEETDTTVQDEPAPTLPPPTLEIPPYNDYYASLDIDPKTRLISGIERIQYTNRIEEPLTEIILRTYLNAFDGTESLKPYFPGFESQIYQYGYDYGYLFIQHVSSDSSDLEYEQTSTVLRVSLSEPLLPEQTTQIRIQFNAYIPMIAHRTGANPYAMWCGAFLPVLAVCDAGGWHTEPYYPAGDPFLLETANYTVEITTPDGYEVTGTGVKREEILEEKKVTTFTAKMTRDFAFALSPMYKIAEASTESGVVIQLYYYSDSLRVDEIMAVSVSAMEYFERTVGAYPYGQLSIAETSMFTRGMEFAKIIFLDSAYLQRLSTYGNLVHELAHQWFFNVVGNNQITEAWLDEGLTSFIQEGFFYETEETLSNILEADYVRLKDALERIESAATRRISASLSLYENWADYYNTHYLKPKVMLYALRQRMGAEDFTRLVSEYYKTYSFRIATGMDFISKAEEVYGAPLDDFFNEWLNGGNLPQLSAR